MAIVVPAVPPLAALIDRWRAVLEEANLRPRILEVNDRFPEERSVAIPFPAVDGSDAELADLLLRHPEEILEAGRRGLRELLPVAGPETEGLRLRVVDLPPTAKRTIRALRETDLGRLVALEGIVRKATEVRPMIQEAAFLCLACRNETREAQDETSPIFREPVECSACGKPAGRTRFRLLPERSKYIDAQRIEIQENPETLKRGAHPQGLQVLLTEDLAGRVLPGNRLVVNGVLKGLQRATGGGRTGLLRSTTFDLLLLGNSLEFQQKEYDEIPISDEEEKLILSFRDDPHVLDRIVLSLAPTIKGMEEEKEAIALQLFGGVAKRHSDGVRVRGDIHILLIGDPGTAKSQLLRYLAEVAPRAVYTSGKGATAAGLTAAAVKDDFAGGRWVLEAGMLVLADGGMAIVDELDKMTPEDRSAMHEALEQQSYHPRFEIMLGNGERRPIAEFVDALFSRFPNDVLPGKDCEILPLDSDRFTVLTTDFRRVHETAITRVSRHKAPDHFIHLTFENGRQLTVTPGHPLFVWRGGEWSSIPAESVRGGEFAPGVSAYPRVLNEAVLEPPRILTGRKQVEFPTALDEGLSRLLGYIVSEGNIWHSRRNRLAEIHVANADPWIVADVRHLFHACFGVEPYVQVHPVSARRKARRTLYDVRAIGVDLIRYFEANFPELLPKATEKRVPGPLFHATEACRVQFLLGAYRGDGFYDSERFGLSTSSENLARDYADLLLSLGIYSRITSSRYRYGTQGVGRAFKIVVSGAGSQRRFYESIARHDPRASRILSFVERSERQSMDRDRLPREFAQRLDSLLRQLRLSDGRFGTLDPEGGFVHRTVARRYLQKIADRLEAAQLVARGVSSPRRLRRSYRIPVREIAVALHRSVAWVELHDQDGRSSQAEAIRRVTEALARQKDDRLRKALRQLSEWTESPIRYVGIRSVESVPNLGEEFVYDVSVEPTHTFVAEGLVLHNSVSIAKAGITATLNARCPVLAAANPKWGRFTPDRGIAEQIDLPPTLLSRFDVIYSIQDRPDQQKDRVLAGRILQSHQEGGAHPESGAVGSPASGVPFSGEFLRKYIAYARRTVRPRLTDSALEVLQEFYVKVRREGEEPDAPVPITARQLEALVRLSEASARARLSSSVSEDDARRATRIMEGFLKRVSATEGRLDIDLVTTGVSHSQRERLDVLTHIMQELQRKAGQFSLAEVKREAEAKGIPAAKTESLFQSLRNQGELVEVRPDVWQLVRF